MRFRKRHSIYYHSSQFVASLTVVLAIAAMLVGITTTLGAPVASAVTVSPASGYWLVASDGGIFSFGGAQFYGSTGGQTISGSVVGMASALGSGGYWEATSTGQVVSFGGAQFYGSMGGKQLNKPIVGIAATTDGGGYWLVASDGGIF